jgi:hypothetical protein
MVRGIGLILVTSALLSAALSMTLGRRRELIALPDRARRCGAT